MNEDIIIGEEIVENNIRNAFERAWKQIVGVSEIREYEVLIWGSAVEDNKKATDLDVIFRYRGSEISPDKEESIRGLIKSETYTEEFTEIDPLITEYSTVPEIISRSRISRVYRVDNGTWIDMSSDS